MRLLLAVFLALAALPLHAATTTLTFGEITGARSWNGAGGYQSALDVVEGDYRYQTASTYFGGAAITLHDDAGGLQTATLARMDGRRFSLKRFTIAGVSRLFRTSDAPFPASGTFAEQDQWATSSEPLGVGWRIQGFVGGVQTAEISSLIAGSAWAPEVRTLDFGRSLGKVESLTVSLFLPTGARYGQQSDWGNYEGYGSGQTWCDGYCGSARFSDVVLSTPVPPAGIVLLTALYGLALFRRRGA